MLSRTVDTQWLTHASFEPAARRDGRQRWQRAIAAVLVLLLLLLTAGRGPIGGLFATSRNLAVAREQQTLLAAEVERLRTQLAVEGATRGELEQHAAELKAEVEELNRQVEFLGARRASVARAN